MAKVLKTLILWLIGGATYICIELAWRGHSHWTMFLVGGLMFVLVGSLNEYFTWEMSLLLQGTLGAALITLAELICGYIINIKLGWHVWDYSGVPMNLAGQICLPFSALWILVAMLAVILDDWARYWLFQEEKPRYRLF